MIAVMSMDIVETLRAMARREHGFTAGQYLFHAGDAVKAMFVVASGEVVLLRHGATGGMVTLQRAGGGAIVAEASLFAQSYHCDAQARAATRVHVVDRAELRARLRRDALLAEAWAAHLARLVQQARLRSEIMALRTVASRLDAWLATAPGEPPAKGEWRGVAEQIGVSPEALYRELARRRARKG
jgi:CRP/FNR family transcriptional regulator, dissimilatory nitrate respiration regulator